MMDIIRRNTDYALRAVVELAERFEDGPVSARQLAYSQKIPRQLACKLLQRLHGAGIVKSQMGPAGGFVLGRNPSKITVRQIVEVVQGPVTLSRCLISKRFCGLSAECPINPELDKFQKNINDFLGGLSLRQLLSSCAERSRTTRTKNGHKRRTK